MKTAVSAILAASVLLGGESGALAAPAADQSPTRVADASQTVRPVASVTESEDDTANCSRSRRRLWVEGEGWIVRRVTTCR
ncbi:hypothetical protein U8607_02780 [Methylobacterium durans]|uniref:hypothetical protein n=1 Tax=Methylobacterium durans TaxID=2202825 RepID=UPI002AFE6203|nr:hypothetical protein [Methylobacterium durans]MEA1830995.1 hypothetical protein [Methylobacterium durans]